ncbi:MAG TPA: FISUMP domain-containing protein, partial [Draconibacterium sp.]|nr:FISUMP domain-containing protein [Draconibacterium sp.]
FNGDSGKFTDTRDNQTYNWIRIGDQIWMAENLAYDVGDGCWAYDNDELNNVYIYGLLYTWEAAQTACPPGWHLPTDNEWKQLEIAIGMSQSEADNTKWRGTNQGTKLKATSGWDDNGNGTDDFGFSALPGGFRHSVGGFDAVGYFGAWWSSTENDNNLAWNRAMHSNSSTVARDIIYNKRFGYGVRCVRDN